MSLHIAVICGRYNILYPYTNLRIVAVPGLIVENVEKRFGPPFLVQVIGGRCLRLAEHVASVHQRRHVLGVAQSRNRRVPGVDRVQDCPFPVRVLVDDGEEYLGQVIAVCIPDVRAQDLVLAVTFKAGLERETEHQMYITERDLRERIRMI